MAVDTQWVALSLQKQIGGKTFQTLLQHFGNDLSVILGASVKDLCQVPRIGKKTAESIRSINLNRIEADIDRWQQRGVQILTWHDDAYPASLKLLDDAPPTVFVRGSLDVLQSQKSIAVVGTRQPSNDALKITEDIIFRVVRLGYTVVSGLAFGIDHHAHSNTIVNQSTNMIAVLGSGVLNVYPPEHRGLAKTIMNGGALLCEVSPDASVSTSGLVSRNRLITGLSDVVVIVESAVDGGAMHAARFARLQQRKLYTVDLPASGNRALIRDGVEVIPADLDLLSF